MKDRLFFPYYSDENSKTIIIDDIKNVYTRLADELSKDIFVNRVLFSLTDDWVYIRKIIKKVNVFKKLKETLSTCQKKIYLYGAGVRGERFPFLFPEYIYGGYIEKNKKKETCNDLPVFSLEQCFSIIKNGDIVLVTNLNDYRKIKQSLIEGGIRNESIIVLEEFYQEASQNMYFDSSCIDIKRLIGKIFIDAGSFDGNDTKKYYEYMKSMGEVNVKSVSFELDKHNYEICKKNLDEYKNADLYNFGLSDVSKKAKIAIGKGVETSLSEDGNEIVETKALDDMLQNSEIGYLKMDIEGAEIKALRGADKIIRTQNPMLAVSIYHKRDDIWEIPKIIISMNPNYKFYIRHYSLSIAETVLYAV